MSFAFCYYRLRGEFKPLTIVPQFRIKYLRTSAFLLDLRSKNKPQIYGW